MRARQILLEGAFGPDDFKVLDLAFADAWREVEPRYKMASGEARAAARERLATIVVMLGKLHYDIAEADELKGRAVEAFCKPDQTQ